MSANHTNAGNSILGRVMLFGMWLAVLAVLALAFEGWLERQDNPNRELRGSVAADGSREVTLERNRSGHYVASGSINGKPVRFMLDTGATDVSIPAAVAERLGLERGRPVQYRTANGVITGFSTRLDRISVGTVEQTGVRASINPYMDGEDILLGMSFLGNLELNQADGRLTLRQRGGDDE